MPGRVRLQGYAFSELMDTERTDYVVQNLNGKPIGNKFLTVKRALEPATYGDATYGDPNTTANLGYSKGRMVTARRM